MNNLWKIVFLVVFATIAHAGIDEDIAMHSNDNPYTFPPSVNLTTRYSIMVLNNVTLLGPTVITCSENATIDYIMIINNSSTVTLKDIVFYNCNHTPLYIGPNTTTTLLNCTFNNTFGAINAHGKLNVTGSSFLNLTDTGISLWSRTDTSVVSSSTFIGNNETCIVGVWNPALTVSDCMFQLNKGDTVRNTEASGLLTLSNCSFVKNYGPVFLYGAAKITNCEFRENSNIDSYAYYPAIQSYASLQIENSQFINNTAQQASSAISVLGPERDIQANLTNCIVENNIGKDAAIYTNIPSGITLNNCKISGNSPSGLYSHKINAIDTELSDAAALPTNTDRSQCNVTYGTGPLKKCSCKSVCSCTASDCSLCKGWNTCSKSAASSFAPSLIVIMLVLFSVALI